AVATPAAGAAGPGLVAAGLSAPAPEAGGSCGPASTAAAGPAGAAPSPKRPDAPAIRAAASTKAAARGAAFFMVNRSMVVILSAIQEGHTYRSWLFSWPPSRTLHARSEEHTSELQSREKIVCRLLP